MLKNRILSNVGWILLITVLLALSVPSMHAQNVSATLTGTVTDASSAIVPKAAVVLKNEASGDIRRTVSNGEGFFTFASIPPASYTVTVTVQGFSTWQMTGVTLDAGDRRNLSNISLKPGQNKEVVTVEATAEQITPVDSGEKSVVITNKTMQNVSIIGQNAAEFIKIMPGMAMPGNTLNQASYTASSESTGGGPMGQFAPNGLRTAALDITSDGAHIIDPGSNAGQAVNTNVDMTAELKVMTSNFGAEANKGPVVVAAVGKSGGQAYHGEAYLYNRSYQLNANDWGNNAAGVDPVTHKMIAARPQSSYWYPGGQIGGPVLIPGTHFNKNKDKLFFFYAQEYYKQAIDNGTYKADVPTAAMRKGDFSNTTYMSHTNGGLGTSGIPAATYPGGLIPAAVLTTPDGKYGAALMNNYPLDNVDPSANSGWNFINAQTRPANMMQIRPRVDYSINDNTKLYVTYNRQRDSQQPSLDTLWTGNAQSWVSPTVPYPTPLTENTHSDSITANLTHVFSPTLTNEAVFTYTYLNLPNQFLNRQKVTRTGLGLDYKTVFSHDNLGNMIQPSMTGWSDGLANMLQTGFEFSGGVYAKKEMPSFTDNLSKVWGTHTAKFGMYWEHTYNEQPGNGDVNGQSVYGGWSPGDLGNPYADLLTSTLNGYDETNFNILPKMRYTSMDFFAQDSWKVTRRLTIDFGTRFQHLGPWNDLGGTGFAVWDQSKYSNNPADRAKLTGLEWHKIDPSIPTSGTPVRMVFIEPRFGFAWDMFGTGKTVLRGGYGMYRYHDEQNVQNGAYSITQGSYDYGVPGGSIYHYSGIGTLNAAGTTPIPSGVTALDVHDDNQPRTQSYSFTVSRRLPWSSVLEVAYVGNHADYLSNYNNSINSLNLLPIGSLFATKDALGNNTNFAWTPTFMSGLNANNYRTMQNYQSIKVINHKMYSNYNSLQVSYNKQAGKFTFMSNFTWSKALGIRGENGATAGDPTNFKNLYGTLPNNRPLIFNVAYVYELPNLAKSNKLMKGIVNNWQISGVTQMQSGTNIQAAISNNLNFGAYFKPGSTFMGYTFPDTGAANATGMNNTNSLGTPDISLTPRVICNPTSNLKAHQYMNGACFAPPAPGTNGDYIMPDMLGPAFYNSDLSAFKNFAWSESRKLQLRFSAYNFLNHPLNSFLGGDAGLNLTYDQSGVLNPKFGYTTQKLGHRIIQCAVKFYF